MDQQVKWGLLGLLAWLALSVPVAVWVGRAIKAYQEPPASKVMWGRRGKPEPTGPQGLPAIPVYPEPQVISVPPDRWGQQAPRAIRDRRGTWGLPENPAQSDRWGQPESQDQWGLWDQ